MDDDFQALVSKTRPRLLQAVEDWSELQAHPKVAKYGHPELWWRAEFQELDRAARTQLARQKEAGGVQGFHVSVWPQGEPYTSIRQGGEGTGWPFALVERLESLGWAWQAPEDGVRPKAGPGQGGGERLPRWWIGSHTPLEVDSLPLDGCTVVVPEGRSGGRQYGPGSTVVVRALPLVPKSLPLRGGGSAVVQVMDAPRRLGRSLFFHTVQAIVVALGLPYRDNQQKREEVARHLPDVFQSSADTSPRGRIARVLENLAR